MATQSSYLKYIFPFWCCVYCGLFIFNMFHLQTSIWESIKTYNSNMEILRTLNFHFKLTLEQQPRRTQLGLYSEGFLKCQSVGSQTFTVNHIRVSYNKKRFSLNLPLYKFECFKMWGVLAKNNNTIFQSKKCFSWAEEPDGLETSFQRILDRFIMYI